MCFTKLGLRKLAAYPQRQAQQAAELPFGLLVAAHHGLHRVCGRDCPRRGPASKLYPGCLSCCRGSAAELISVFTVTLQTITEDVHGTTLEAFWANIAFLLLVTIVQPVYTSLSDIMGRKLPLYAAFLLFTVGSIAFAVAKSLPVVILGRAIQGLGCGGIDVLNEIIIADITTLKERAFYIGMLSIPMALGTVLGPIIGAVFSDYVSWRWIGWINLPLVAICLPLTVFCLRLKPMPDTFWQQLSRVDWLGMGLFTIGAVLFTLPPQLGRCHVSVEFLEDVAVDKTARQCGRSSLVSKDAVWKHGFCRL